MLSMSSKRSAAPLLGNLIRVQLLFQGAVDARMPIPRLAQQRLAFGAFGKREQAKSRREAYSIYFLFFFRKNSYMLNRFG